MEIPLVELRLDVASLGLPTLLQLLQPSHVDLVVEVTDVANNRLVLHLEHVLGIDDVLVPRRCDENVRSGNKVFDSLDFIAFHRRLQCTNRIDFGDDHAATLTSQRLATTLAHVPISANNRDLARKHHVRRTIQSVNQRVTATVQIVELALRHRVVDVDRWEQQFTLRSHLIQTLDTRGGFFRYPTNGFAHRCITSLGNYQFLTQQIQNHAELFWLGLWIEVWDFAVRFVLRSQVDQHGRIATIVNNQIWSSSIWPYQRFLRAPPVFGQCLALPSVHWGPNWMIQRSASPNYNGRCRCVLGRENVATNPTYISTKVDQGLDQDGGLDGHVQRPHHLRARQRLARTISLAKSHQTWHLIFCQLDFFAAQARNFFCIFSLALFEQIKRPHLERYAARVTRCQGLAGC